MAMNSSHRRILSKYNFMRWGRLGFALESNACDGIRVLYAITDPKATRVVYVGDTEIGRNVRARLKAHLADTKKSGLVEINSWVWIHQMVTEYLVLDDFEESTGGLPELNVRKTQKWPGSRRK